MQHSNNDECRWHHTAICWIQGAGARLVSGGLIACTAATMLVTGASADILDALTGGDEDPTGSPGIGALLAEEILGLPIAGDTGSTQTSNTTTLSAEETLDAVSAGNGGTATASGTSTLIAGDIYGGGNTGNSVELGDVINSTVEIDGGTVNNPTLNILSMPAGIQIASADGGNDTQARLEGGEDGPPVNVDVDVRNRNRNSNENTLDYTDDSTTNNNLLAVPSG